MKRLQKCLLFFSFMLFMPSYFLQALQLVLLDALKNDPKALIAEMHIGKWKQNDINRALLETCNHEYIIDEKISREYLVDLLIEGLHADVNYIFQAYHCTPLFYACSSGYTSIVEKLLAAGATATINTPAINTFAPIHVAAQKGFTAIVALLIKNNAALDQRAKTATPLHYAVYGNHSDIVELLIRAGADIEIRVKEGDTPLLWATSIQDTPTTASDHLRIVQLLIDAGADVNAKNKVGSTPLFKAITFQLYNIVELLINAGADVNEKTDLGLTPLFQAVFLQNIEIAQLLVNAGADVNEKSFHKEFKECTPLWIAAFYGDVKMVKFLLENEADVNRRNSQGYSPLSIAIQNKHARVVKLLTAAGAAETITELP